MNQDRSIRPCPLALTIAGSDSGGGAGIQADLKTFTTLGVYGMSAITAVTAQNTIAVTHVEVLPVASVTAQIDAVMDDIGCDAAKTGMLATAAIVAAVAECVRRHSIANLVVDPVMISKSGHALLDEDACGNLRELLLPLALVATPNIPEAEALTGISITSPGDIMSAAEAICSTGCRAAIIKGGHAQGAADDHLYIADSGRVITLAGDRIPTGNTHGTGCTFSAALAASLACGMSLEHSAHRAKKHVTAAIANALPLGKGHGPTNHIAAGGAFRDERRTGP